MYNIGGYLVRHKMVKLSYILQLVIFTFVLFFPTVGHAENFPYSLNYDLNSDGTVAVIPLNSNIVGAAKEFVQQLQASSIIHVSAMVYAPPELPPYMVLSGNPPDLQQALALLQKLLPDTMPAYLIVISASLRELTQSASSYIGLNPIPTVTGRATTDWSKTTGSSITRTDIQHVEANSSDILALNEGLNNSKVLVSSEVYTPNGIKAYISNIKSVPIFSTDNAGNVQTQFQNLETSISVLPTVIEYNADKPETSRIRADVEVKVSIISGSVAFKSVSAPEYSIKTMTTTRMLPADNQSYIIGTFVTDSDTKTISRVPILGQLPLLKYLFSQEQKSTQRNTAVLTLAVRLLPLFPAAEPSH